MPSGFTQLEDDQGEENAIKSLAGKDNGWNPVDKLFANLDGSFPRLADEVPKCTGASKSADKKRQLGQSSPILVHLFFYGYTGAFIAVAMTQDLTPYIEWFSLLSLFWFAAFGATFTMFGYFLNPNLFCYGANVFSFGERLFLGKPFKLFKLADSYAMFQGASDVFQDECKNHIAANFMFAISIKLRVEGSFCLTSLIVCVYAMYLDLAERKLLHLFTFIAGMLVMAADLNHVRLIPFNLFGYNHSVNNIGRFIGYSFGVFWIPFNFMNAVVCYNYFFPLDAPDAPEVLLPAAAAAAAEVLLSPATPPPILVDI